MSDDTCLLFVYGLLRPGIRPPRTMRSHWPDRVIGELHHLGPYPGAIRIGKGSASFEGDIVEIATSELPALDEFEDVDTGLYARIRTTTLGGHDVWIYEYRRPLSPLATPIERWESNASSGSPLT
ncbi:hypothetical protein Pan216_05270 [Planctomycetes bacterium Pan216]|uniref:Gamma-glutamylcyclotransferase AIG2-like domain-containing protein n=1 Tax=Kolteria novifilia TaxID=2527975 RepID=A0A518AY92_9BACT|nr:hypothetical protein Pan216_05270 [Planctomycetes bacterium Pan216]